MNRHTRPFARSVRNVQGPGGSRTYFSHMIRWLMVAISLACLPWMACAQVVVPFTTANDRFGVFQAGRFQTLESRAPLSVWPMGERLAYVAHDGRLMLFHQGQALVLAQGLPADTASRSAVVKASRTTIAWRDGPMLRVAQDGRSHELGREVGSFSVHDSLVVFHDLAERTLNVLWKGRSFPVADVAHLTEAPQWKAGANTLVFHDRSSGKVHLCYRGEVRMLCDSAGHALVDAGLDVVAFMDDAADMFRVFHRGRIHDVEQLRPARFTAAAGLVAYISATGGFRVFQDGSVHRVSSSAPTDFFTRDSTVTWIGEGRWNTFCHGLVETIERYVPESWQASGTVLAYPDLNRELRLFRLGERTVVTTEAGIRHFLLVDDAVTWTSAEGDVRVWWQGRVYEHE